MKPNGLYRNRYILALYDRNDFPRFVALNAQELSAWSGMKLHTIHQYLNHIFNGRRKSRICKLDLHFIEIEEQEMSEYLGSCNRKESLEISS